MSRLTALYLVALGFLATIVLGTFLRTVMFFSHKTFGNYWDLHLLSSLSLIFVAMLVALEALILVRVVRKLKAHVDEGEWSPRGIMEFNLYHKWGKVRCMYSIPACLIAFCQFIAIHLVVLWIVVDFVLAAGFRTMVCVMCFL